MNSSHLLTDRLGAQVRSDDFESRLRATRTTRFVGERVALEPLTQDHEAGLFKAASHVGIWRYTQMHALGNPLPTEREAFHTDFMAVLASAERGERIPFATTLKATDQLVGSSSYCTLRPKHLGVEIGWTWLTPSTWGMGINAEAKLLMLRHAFEVAGCQRVEFETDALNERSRRALEALPATFEGVLRDWKRVYEVRRSSAVYSILDREWPEVKEHLKKRLAKRPLV